uniref:Calmodulin-binding domain-containing protein n=1 Tax=Cajanus cajan TaxID=3821 RepID=A0A151RCW0_CAJCA|nr:hypothetical protein KK1_038375 [Cajanus cajan]
MANESVELPLTPEVTKSPGVEIKKHSAGKASSGASVEKSVPNYLRASTGSCHDICKYGGKHAFELKERRSIPNRATRKQLHQSSEGRVEILSIKEVRSPSKLTSKKVGTTSTSRKVEAPSKSSPNKMMTLKSTSNKVGNPSISTSKVKTSSKSATNVVKTSSQLSSLKDGVGGQRFNKIKMEKGVASSKAASKKLMAPSNAFLSPRPSLLRVASINSRKHKSLKIAPHLKNQRTARKVEHEEHNNNEVEEKTLYVIKMEGENKTLQSDQNASYDDESYLPQLSSPKSSVSSISQSLSQGDQEESEYTTSEFEDDSFSGSHEIECMGNEETLEAEMKVKPKKDGVAYSKGKDNQMIKLKFRRGKVVENETQISSPRRLKFRRTRVLVEKANAKGVARKSFERRDEACVDSNDATTGPEKVVLRHQDMQDKKDAQGLLNNVIEEAASKLVEARKRTVKALVGAFETVISLHEKKPSASANTVT